MGNMVFHDDVGEKNFSQAISHYHKCNIAVTKVQGTLLFQKLLLKIYALKRSCTQLPINITFNN